MPMKPVLCLFLIAALLSPAIPTVVRADDSPPSIKADTIVALDGSGKFKSVHEAIMAAPQTNTPANPWVIYVKPGTYKELVYVQRERGNIRLVGADANTTIITYNLNAKMPGPDGKDI